MPSMKVLFILENTIKSLEGGTEVSSFHLARLLRHKKIEVEEWAPYSKRMPIYFYTGIFFQIGIFLLLLWKCVKNRTQILHIQGKYLLSQAILVGKIFNISTVATIRDYIVVCPIALCLFEGPALPLQGRAFSDLHHGFWFYLTKEIPGFLSIYHQNDRLMIRIIKYLFLIRGWLVTKRLRFWLKRADAVISVSEAVQKILGQSGISSQVIHNSFDTGFIKTFPSSIIYHPSSILFVGKPSYGKGYDIFQALSRMDEFKRFEFKTIGGDKTLGYEDTLKEMGQALVVIVPSRWPEPFGRVALESLIMGTPVLATKRGGLPEIVENGVTGILTNPTAEAMTNALRLIIKQNKKFRDKIKIGKKLLTKKFGSTPLKSYVNLYSSFLAKISSR